MDDPRAKSCRVCHLPDERVLDSDELVLVVRDAYPVSEGHTLILVRRHVSSVFDVTAEEWLAVHAALGRARSDLDQRFAPDGCT
jgi:diadenosine tetraphosphate (Ap4A) HIT family hydrolase